MAYCPYCTQGLPPDAKWCPNCRRALTDASFSPFGKGAKANVGPPKAAPKPAPPKPDSPKAAPARAPIPSMTTPPRRAVPQTPAPKPEAPIVPAPKAVVVEDFSAEAEQPGAAEREALYALEAPACCPHCLLPIRTVQVLRLTRTQVAFTSTLPRGGRAVVCPDCKRILSVELGGLP